MFVKNNFKIPGFVFSILIFYFLSMISSCNQNRMGEFTEEELSWLVYQNHDTLRFKDEFGNQHRLIVDYRNDFSQLKNYYPIEAEIEIFNPDDNERFRIYLLKDASSFKRFLRMADVYRPLDLIQPLDSMRIGNRFYHNVYVFTEDTASIQSDVWRVYFNKKHGILRYDKRGDISYQLIPAKK